MTKQELLKRVGSVEQIGGIKDFVYNDGKAKGVRGIEINTGRICFTVLPDRCLDIAQASFDGKPLAWISKSGLSDGRFYEKDGRSSLRGFAGGLVFTCGLKNIGGPTDEYGLHDRVAFIPAEKVSVFADWVGDDYIMEVSGQIRQSSVFGENIVIKRTIRTKLFSDSFELEDTLINENFEDENIALAYHCNFGYPLVTEGAKIVNVPEDIADITAPIHGKKEECICVDVPDGEFATFGIKNDEMSAYITYKTATCPEFLIWKMLGESEYVVGLEPRTTNYGGNNIIKNNAFVVLKPFEEYKTYLKFEFKKEK